jgi:hypothetical protein
MPGSNVGSLGQASCARSDHCTGSGSVSSSHEELSSRLAGLPELNVPQSSALREEDADGYCGDHEDYYEKLHGLSGEAHELAEREFAREFLDRAQSDLCIFWIVAVEALWRADGYPSMPTLGTVINVWKRLDVARQVAHVAICRGHHMVRRVLAHAAASAARVRAAAWRRRWARTARRARVLAKALSLSSRSAPPADVSCPSGKHRGGGCADGGGGEQVCDIGRMCSGIVAAVGRKRPRALTDIEKRPRFPD